MFALMYCARVVWKVSVLAFIWNICLIITIFRCMARSKSLDSDAPLPHCQEHSNVLVELLELGILWDEYGLIGDIVVCTLLLHPLIGP